MAETTGVNYSLDSGTINAVKEAGLGGDAREHLTNAAIANEAMNIATDVKDQIVEKQEDIAEREEAWDVGFDAMGDRGSWASGELFDQFQELESGYRDEYVAAVQSGDIKAQQRMLKDQATRASGLDGWKKTMESASAINKSPGWSNAFLGDDPESIENRQIMRALSSLDGKTAVTRFGENGEMVFDIQVGNPPKTRTMTRRQVDEMVAKGVKPYKLQVEHLKGLEQASLDGAAGKPFNFETQRDLYEMTITDESIPSLMTADLGGGGSFSQHILAHPDMLSSFQGYEYSTKVKPVDEDGNVVKGGLVSPSDPNSPGGEKITPEEVKSFTDDDKKRIVKEMGAKGNEKIAKKYIADWRTRMLQKQHETAKTSEAMANLKKQLENFTDKQREEFIEKYSATDYFKIIMQGTGLEE
jgi:hypothetical protein